MEDNSIDKNESSEIPDEVLFKLIKERRDIKRIANDKVLVKFKTDNWSKAGDGESYLKNFAHIAEAVIANTDEDILADIWTEGKSSELIEKAVGQTSGSEIIGYGYVDSVGLLEDGSLKVPVLYGFNPILDADFDEKIEELENYPNGFSDRGIPFTEYQMSYSDAKRSLLLHTFDDDELMIFIGGTELERKDLGNLVYRSRHHFSETPKDEEMNIFDFKEWGAANGLINKIMTYVNEWKPSDDYDYDEEYLRVGVGRVHIANIEHAMEYTNQLRELVTMLGFSEVLVISGDDIEDVRVFIDELIVNWWGRRFDFNSWKAHIFYLTE